MIKFLASLKSAHPQTKFFVFNFAIYMIAIIWTTVQVFLRLEYYRSDIQHINSELQHLKQDNKKNQSNSAF